MSIVWQIIYEKSPISVSTKSFRNWKDLDIEKWCDGLNLDSLDYTTNGLETFLGDWLMKIEQLAEDFGEYFLNKIVKLGDDLDECGKSVVESHDHVKELQACCPLSETEVHKVIKKLQTKSCELDHIPTYIVKHHLDYFIKPYTHVVNLSLVNGKFVDT